jgi:hypothetical protein
MRQHNTTPDPGAAHGLCRPGDCLPPVNGRWMALHDLPEWYACLEADGIAIIHHGILLIWSLYGLILRVQVYLGFNSIKEFSRSPIAFFPQNEKNALHGTYNYIYL